MRRVKSTYRDEWSSQKVHSQLNALAMSEDDDLKHEALDSQSGFNALNIPDFRLAGIETMTN